MRTSLTAIARRVLRWEFVPEAVLFVGLTAFLFDQNDAATSAFKSTKAVAIMAVVSLGWLGARVALARLARSALTRAAVFSVAAVLALAVVVFPAYDDDTVVEAFPTATTAVSSPPAMPAPPAELAAPMATQPAPAAAQQDPAPTPTTSTTVTPSTAASTPTTVAETSTTTTTTPPKAEAAAMPAEPAPAPAASGPQRLRSGSFRGIDHRAEGTVAIYRQPDGRYVIGLEDIDIQPGPDYDLYLVPGDDREDTKGGVRLGDLRGNRGTQFYEVPPGVDLENGPWTVLVWCQTFAVPVANSTPS
jgi:hypothetical protein